MLSLTVLYKRKLLTTVPFVQPRYILCRRWSKGFFPFRTGALVFVHIRACKCTGRHLDRWQVVSRISEWLVLLMDVTEYSSTFPQHGSLEGWTNQPTPPTATTTTPMWFKSAFKLSYVQFSCMPTTQVEVQVCIFNIFFASRVFTFNITLVMSGRFAWTQGILNVHNQNVELFTFILHQKKRKEKNTRWNAWTTPLNIITSHGNQSLPAAGSFSSGGSRIFLSERPSGWYISHRATKYLSNFGKVYIHFTTSTPATGAVGWQAVSHLSSGQHWRAAFSWEWR